MKNSESKILGCEASKYEGSKNQNLIAFVTVYVN